MKRRKRRAAAQKIQRTSIGSDSTSSGAGTVKEGRASTPAAIHEAGLAHMQGGRSRDARLCCQQALAADPNHADTLHLMGLLFLHAKQYDHSVEWIAHAIRQDPKPHYLASLGATLHRQGRQEEALKAFDKAVQLKPDDVELWVKLGAALAEFGRPAHALMTYQHALKLGPRHWDAAHCSGS